MKISANQMGMEMIITKEATKISKESVADKKFMMIPPEGYKKVINI